MQSWGVFGATVAVSRNGRLVYARGFGWSDIEHNVAMQPNTLCRIASVSKAITAVAVLKLVEEGKLSLDDRAFAILKELKPCDAKSRSVDPRLYQITVRDLLQMSAGWDRNHQGDPMFAPLVHQASYHCSPTLRADSLSIIRYWMNEPLVFDPGTHYAYSNLCYAVLEQLVMRASGQRYSEYVKTNVLLPMGITDMRLGHTLKREPGETVYYPFPGQEQTNSYFPNVKGVVPLAYGGDFALEALAAPAGWIGSSIDLVKFISNVNGDGKQKAPLSKQMFATMLARPKIRFWEKEPTYFALGWEVSPLAGNKLIYWRTGSFPGSMAFVIQQEDGTAWAVEVNSRPMSQLQFLKEMRMLVGQAVRSQKQWPDGDLFDEYK
jgi:N-acyl-D-amino-acid deacylase